SNSSGEILRGEGAAGRSSIRMSRPADPSGVFPDCARFAAMRRRPRPGRTDMKSFGAALSVAFALLSVSAMAADYPAPEQGDWVAKAFKFHTGASLPELKLHYTTVGAPTGPPVLVLHGSGGWAGSTLRPGFAGEMVGPGQPLDASKYWIIIPGGIG